MLEFLLALVIGAFLFAVFGVIALLGKTKRLAKELEELKRNVRNLSCELSIVKDPNLVSADWRSLSKEPSAPPAPETGPLASAAPPTAVFTPVTAAPWPEPAARVEPMPKPAAQAAPSAPETPAPESGAAGGRIAAFIRGGSVWAAGGVLLLIAAFAMLMTYMARRGFFTLEMRIAAAALWFTVTLFMPGSPAPLPLYIPVLNPLELQQALCAVVIVVTQRAAGRADLPSMGRPAVLALADIMAFFWITSMLARGLHFFAGVPFAAAGSSGAFKFGLFVFWAFWGIGHIILGHRLARRPLWIAGAILTVADIAKLLLLDMTNTGTAARIVSFFIAGLALLFIGWAAPLPPVPKKDGL